MLVHGSWGDASNWPWVVDRLAEHHEVGTYDRRGHSRSSDGPGPGSRRQDADEKCDACLSVGTASPSTLLASTHEVALLVPHSELEVFEGWDTSPR